MYTKSKQKNHKDQRQSIQKLKVPKMHGKVYSFTDPLFQSFGNDGYQGIKNLQNYQNQAQYTKIGLNDLHSSEIESQNLSQLMEISSKIDLMQKMLKINKRVTNASVLMVNSQNRMKTQMLISNKKMNKDEDSIILCKNANKYLSFLDAVNDLQCGYSLDTSFYQQDIRINSESKGEKSQVWSNKQSRQKQNPSFGENMISYKSNNYLQSSRNNFSQLQSKAYQFFSHDNSNHLESNPKISQFKSDYSTAEKMFHGIKTPKYTENQKQAVFTPLKKQSKIVYFQTKAEKNTKNLKSPNSSAVIQIAKNKKITQPKISNPIKTNSINQREKMTQNERYETVKTSRSKSISQRFKHSKIKDKKVQQKDKKELTKNKSFRMNIQAEKNSKNLALKTLDKTSQFEKMLKMTSSRMNPC